MVLSSSLVLLLQLNHIRTSDVSFLSRSNNSEVVLLQGKLSHGCSYSRPVGSLILCVWNICPRIHTVAIATLSPWAAASCVDVFLWSQSAACGHVAFNAPYMESPSTPRWSTKPPSCLKSDWWCATREAYFFSCYLLFIYFVLLGRGGWNQSISINFGIS